MSRKVESWVPKPKRLKLHSEEPTSRLGWLATPGIFKSAKKNRLIIQEWYLEQWQAAIHDNQTFAVRKACQKMLQFFLAEWPMNPAVVTQAHELIRRIIWFVYQISHYEVDVSDEALESLAAQIRRTEHYVEEMKIGLAEGGSESKDPEVIRFYQDLRAYAVDLLRRLE